MPSDLESSNLLTNKLIFTLYWPIFPLAAYLNYIVPEITHLTDNYCTNLHITKCVCTLIFRRYKLKIAKEGVLFCRRENPGLEIELALTLAQY